MQKTKSFLRFTPIMTKLGFKCTTPSQSSRPSWIPWFSLSEQGYTKKLRRTESARRSRVELQSFGENSTP